MTAPRRRDDHEIAPHAKHPQPDLDVLRVHEELFAKPAELRPYLAAREHRRSADVRNGERPHESSVFDLIPTREIDADPGSQSDLASRKPDLARRLVEHDSR